MITVEHRKQIEAIGRTAIKKLTGRDTKVSLAGYRNIEFCCFENAVTFPFGEFQIVVGDDTYVMEVSFSGVKSLFPGTLEWV